MSTIGKVESLWRYPVKSMRGEELEEAFAGYPGVYGDRVFAFKFQGALAFSSWAFLLLGGPVLIAYGLVCGGPWYYYLYLLLFFDFHPEAHLLLYKRYDAVAARVYGRPSPLPECLAFAVAAGFHPNNLGKQCAVVVAIVVLGNDL